MVTRVQSSRRIVYGISLVAMGTFAALGPWITPSVAFVAPLQIDILALTFLGVLALPPGKERVRGGAGVGGEATGVGGSGAGIWAWVPHMVAGGLLGAAFVEPWAAFPWLVGSALGIAWAGKGRNPKPGFRRSGLAVALLAAVVNCAVLAVASSRGVRISPEDFATRDLRVNSLLADVPLHDVWAIDLEGHPSPTLTELGDAFQTFSPFQATPAVMGLSMLRGVVGSAFGWEDPRWSDTNSSLVNRLTEADRQRSTTEPGTTFGNWRVLYSCPQEGVVETINGTVHVAVAATIGEGPQGPRLFLSFRVREVNWTTRWYMRLIDPSRRHFLYPFLLKQFAHTWEKGDWDRPEEILNGEEK